MNIIESSTQEIKWLICNGVILNTKNIEQIFLIENRIKITWISGKETFLDTADPESVFNSLKEILAGKP